MKLATVFAILACAGVTLGQSEPQPLTEVVDTDTCIFDGVNRYRVTWQVHHLALNSSTETFYVSAGFPFDPNHAGYCPGEGGFGGSTGSHTVMYTAVVTTDPCALVGSSTFTSTTDIQYVWDCGQFTSPIDIQFSDADIEDLAEQTRGIVVGDVVGVVGPPGSPPCASIAYSVERRNKYDFEVYAQATGTCAGGVRVLVGKGEYLTEAPDGKNCAQCAFLWNGGYVDPDPPPPPPPPPPGGNPPNDDEPGDGGDGGGLTSGACCDFDGNCSEVVPADCIDGHFFPYTSCAEVDCESTPVPPQIGACCAMDGETRYCVDSVTRDQCLELGPGSRFLGVGTFCMADGQCPPYIDDLCCELIVTNLVAIRNRLDGWDHFFEDDFPSLLEIMEGFRDGAGTASRTFDDLPDAPEDWLPESASLLDGFVDDGEEFIPFDTPDLPDSIKSLDVDGTTTDAPIFTMHRPRLPTFNGWVPVFDETWEPFTVDLTDAVPMRNLVRVVSIMFASVSGMYIIFRAVERK